MSEVETSLDSILGHLGEFGKYQTIVFSLVCLSVVFHSAVHIAYVFTAMDLSYRCEIPGCDINYSEFNPPWLTNAVPFSNEVPQKCQKFVPFHNETSKCSTTDFDRAETETCSSFVYKTKEISIVQEYNLHCKDNYWKLGFVGTINNIGQFFGLFIGGFLSDKFGRKVVLIWGMVLCGVFGMLRSITPSYTWFLVSEFLDAAFGAGSYICGFIIGVELVGPKKRVWTSTIISSCYAVGEVFTAGSAWLVQSWKPLIYVLYTPPLLLICYLWLIPESIRWNLSKGNVEEAKKTLRTCAKINGKSISENVLEKLSSIKVEEEEHNRHSFIEVLKSPVLVLRFINCCFCWVTCAFLFYGLTLNSVALAGNHYLDFILTSLVEIPAYFACIYLLNSLGRKTSLTGSFLFTGAACATFIFIPKGYYYGSLIVYLLGKFAATAAFTVTYVITSEMFPTPIRHSIMATCSTFGRIGSMVSPQTPLLAQIWNPLPLVMFASMSIVAALLTLFFPETFNTNLPDTIEEAISIGKKKNDTEKL